MAVTLQVFLDSFPEFKDVACKHETLVQAKLADAAVLIDPEVYGTNADVACKYLAAHLLAISPCGRSAGLSEGGGDSAYLPLVKKLKKSASPLGCRVT